LRRVTVSFIDCLHYSDFFSSCFTNLLTFWRQLLLLVDHRGWLFNQCSLKVYLSIFIFSIFYFSTLQFCIFFAFLYINFSIFCPVIKKSSFTKPAAIAHVNCNECFVVILIFKIKLYVFHNICNHRKNIDFIPQFTTYIYIFLIFDSYATCLFSHTKQKKKKGCTNIYCFFLFFISIGLSTLYYIFYCAFVNLHYLIQ
jgi:hypothetical protein